MDSYWPKNSVRSATRSLITGMCGKGETVISLPGTSDQAWVQANVFSAAEG